MLHDKLEKSKALEVKDEDVKALKKQRDDIIQEKDKEIDSKQRELEALMQDNSKMCDEMGFLRKTTNKAIDKHAG